MKQVIISDIISKKPKVDYPYLGKNERGDLVWFVSKGEGIALKHLGKYEDEGPRFTITIWPEDDFTPFEGNLHFSLKP